MSKISKILLPNAASYEIADKDAEEAIVSLQDGLGIISNGNTHPAIKTGQYVYIIEHPTLDSGLYKALMAVNANGELSSTNVVALNSGGLNDMLSFLDPVIITSLFHLTLPSNVTLHDNGFNVYKTGNVITIRFGFKIANATSGTLVRIPYSVDLIKYKPYFSLVTMADNGNTTGYTKVFLSSSNIDIYPQSAGTTFAIGYFTYVPTFTIV